MVEFVEVVQGNSVVIIWWFAMSGVKHYSIEEIELRCEKGLYVAHTFIAWYREYECPSVKHLFFNKIMISHHTVDQRGIDVRTRGMITIKTDGCLVQYV